MAFMMDCVQQTLKLSFVNFPGLQKLESKKNLFYPDSLAAKVLDVIQAESIKRICARFGRPKWHRGCTSAVLVFFLESAAMEGIFSCSNINTDISVQ